MNKPLLFLLAVVLTAPACTSRTQPVTSTTNERAGNPIADGWYADPEGLIFEDKYWVYPTYSAAYEDQVFFDAFSSPDLVNWTKHPRILDTTAVQWAERALWAPSVVRKDGRYYFFFAANDIQESGEAGGIGVAVADRPEGPFVDHIGAPLLNTFYNDAQPIDQFVFQDTDGQYYMIYGGWRHANIARLNEDFTGFLPFDDGSIVREITPEGYVEGPVMFRRDGKYYFMWSEGGWGGDDYRVAYAIGDTPFGPFERLDTILEKDPDVATGAGHHSVLNIPGTDEWYIVYHRRPIPNEGRDHRVTSIDKMYFNPDGTIKPVVMTFEGVAPRPLP